MEGLQTALRLSTSGHHAAIPDCLSSACSCIATSATFTTTITDSHVDDHYYSSCCYEHIFCDNYHCHNYRHPTNTLWGQDGCFSGLGHVAQIYYGTGNRNLTPLSLWLALCENECLGRSHRYLSANLRNLGLWFRLGRSF